MQYDVATYGNAALRLKAEPVTGIDDEIRQLAGDMLEAMHRNGGLGLAAEQVGRREAVFVIDIPRDAVTEDQGAPRMKPVLEMPLVMINPRILEMKGEQTGQEGCLSFPEVFVDVTRAAEVTVSFTDLQSTQKNLTVWGLLARAVQHEADHLDGVLLVDRMSPVQKAALSGKLKRIRKKSRPQ